MSAGASASASASGAPNPHVDRVVLTAQQRREAPSVQQADDDTDGSSLLSAFLYPLTPAHFLSSVWKQKALHLAWGEDHSNGAEAAQPDQTASAPAAAAVGSKRKKGAQHQGSGKAAKAAATPAPDRMAYVKRAHLERLRLSSLLEETASDNIFVWMKPSAASAASRSSASAPAATTTALHSFELDASNPAHLAAAQTLHASGASLYFRSPPSMVPEYVGGFSAAVGLNFAGVEAQSEGGAGPAAPPTPKGEIEVFCSRAGHVTDWHFDFMENFTFQLAGSKTWHLRRSSVAHPLRGATPHYTNTEVEEQQCKVHALTDPNFAWADRPRTRANATAAAASPEEEYETVHLRAGDCFYHPAGIWHRVECSEDSVSVNISLVATDWSSLVCDGLKQKLWGTDEWRSGISIHNMSEARSYLSKRLDHLRATVASLRAEDFLPNALFLPRQSHYVIQSIKCDDDNCGALCARAAIVEQEKKDAAAEETEAAPKRKKAKSASGAAVASPTDAAASSPSSTAPLLISSLGPSSRFRVNPLGVLLRFDHGKRARVARQQKRDERERKQAQRLLEGDQSDEEEEEEDQDEEEGVDSDAEEDDGESKLGYVLHFSFGNESLESSVRVTIDLSSSLEPEMECVRRMVMMEKRGEFEWNDAVKRLQQQQPAAPKSNRHDGLRKLLFFFTQQGLLHLLP